MLMEMSRAHEEHLRELLQECPLPRDALPYTDEFLRLKGAFWERSFKQLTDGEFWQAILRFAKKGGVRGKRRVSAPILTEDQKSRLRARLPVPIGERDRLPYTEKFDKLVEGFNRETGLRLGAREIWRAVASLGK